ncbi:DNA polymerase I, partial [Pseudoxanthomonas sp. SGD-10]
MKKLFLLDGMALIYRAHFALSKNPRFTSTGINTSAVMGFTNTLLEVLKKENPTHMAVVFDTEAPTERHTDFESYKANRQAMPEDLSIALPYVKKLIEGFNIPVITSDGYEADDVIGTLAKQAEQQGYTVYCMTPDKDFAQLVSENIFIYKPARMGNDMEILGVKEVLAKWEVEHVHQVIDILGLWGDAVDNIPGIPGIGEKTAKALIKQYGSVEEIIANSHELKGKQRENVENFAAQGILSKRLATILLDAPVEFHEEDFLIKEPSKEILEPLFAELEFRTLGKRVFGESFSVAEARPGSGQMDLFGTISESNQPIQKPSVVNEVIPGKNISNTEHNYILIDNLDELKKLTATLLQQTAVSMDTETTGLDANNAELVGLSFAYQAREAYYVAVPKEEKGILEFLEVLRPFLENENIRKIGQNLKYDYIILKWYGINLKGEFFDTMLAHYLLDPDTRHNMDVLSENYLGYTPISITELIGKGKNQLNMRDVDIAKVTDYAAEDADVTLQLQQVFEPLLIEAKAEKLAKEIENPLIYVLGDMEKEGVRIDVAQLVKFSRELQHDIAQLEQTVYEKAGHRFNIAS